MQSSSGSREVFLLGEDGEPRSTRAIGPGGVAPVEQHSQRPATLSG